ncbi:hypothetical protein [Lacrimispora sp.]|jgi:hypothetical protein|uniref:hypothetical protein n=1 Tax=Lacrimispora sp. TaxID=2719234 RepID=UPI0029E63E1B|nr:hypothetical protein [Lacrimispora sp.]
MKQLLTKMGVFLMVAVMSVSIAACGNQDKKADGKKQPETTLSSKVTKEKKKAPKRKKETSAAVKKETSAAVKKEEKETTQAVKKTEPAKSADNKKTDMSTTKKK